MGQARLSQITGRLSQIQNRISRSDYRSRVRLAGKTHLDESTGVYRRDLYEALGYPRSLKYEDYLDLYERMHIAAKVVDLAPNDTWRGGFVLVDGDVVNGDTKSLFVKAWQQANREGQLIRQMKRADRLSRIGHYGAIVIGWEDSVTDMSQPVTRASGVAYLRGVTEGQCGFSSYIDNSSDPLHGRPEYYNIRMVDSGDGGVVTGESRHEVEYHYSRVIHIAEDVIDGVNIGTPALRRVYNLLQDLMKALGGSAEAFWMTADRGIHANASDGGFINAPASSTQDDDDALLDEIEAYVDKLQRYIVTSGVDITPLGSDAVDPTGIVDKIVEMIAAASHIPQRLLIGSERGELASTQDESYWNKMISSRQSGFAEAEIVRPLIDRMIEYGALPAPKAGYYSIQWPELYGQPISAKATTFKMLVEGLSVLYNSGVGDMVDPKELVRVFLGDETATIIEDLPVIEPVEDGDIPGPDPDNLIPDAEG